MGADQSKPKRKLEEIEREVRLIRSNLRASNRSYSKEIKNSIQENLVKYSNQANELKGKVKNKQLDSIQKNISQTMKEVLTVDTELDNAAIETDSIVQISQNLQNRKTVSLERPKNGTKMRIQSKSMPSLTNSPNLQDVDNKLKTLKSQIKVALQSEDTTQLRVYLQTLKVLATSLEMIDVPEDTPLGDRKNKLEKIVTSQYHTINKTLREIKRNRDIKYLTKLQHKDSVTKELEIIKKELEKYDSLSREAIKTGDKGTVRDVQQSLLNLKQRINSVESIDDNIKTLKLQMKDKISWLSKFILESSHKGSQPDLSKAQTDYEDIIKNIARGRNKNGSDLKDKLEKLHSFTNSISSLNEENNKRKQQLLNNISQSLITLNSNGNYSETTTNVIELQESELKKKLTSFVNTWHELETTLKNSNVSHEFSKYTENVLSNLLHSIGETRKSLKNQYFKIDISSYSTPVITEINGNNSQNKETSDAERRSDQSETEATMEKMLIQLSNASKIRPEETRFSRINEIKTQVYYIKEKFETSIQKPNLKTKLEDYIRTLEEYIKSDNEVIANSARILMTDIYDIIKNIDHSMSRNADVLPLGYYLDVISRMENNVSKLERTAKSFQADRNDTGYQDTKKLLNETKEYLETFDIPREYENAINKKMQVLKKTGQIIDQCDKEYLKREEAYVTEVRKTLEVLRDRIDRFNGPYKGVLYNSIEKDLNKILIDADANITDKLVLDEIIKKTEKYLKILENRATKDQKLDQPKKLEHNEKMSALKEELQAIKSDIDNTPINAINIFIGLNSRLDLIKLSLDQLKNLDENTEHQKEIIYNEIETLKNVVEAKIALGQQDINQNSLEEFKKKATEENDRRMNEELDKIELTFGKLKEDINNFIGTKSDKKYYDLDESTMRLILKMDELKLPKGTQLYDRKVELLKQIHQYENFLEKRTRETENITQFERDVNDIELNFPIFEKSVGDLDHLTERLETLRLNLDVTKCNTPLRERKTICIKKINELKDKIRTKMNENILIEESLLQVKYNLDLMRKHVQNDSSSFTDLKSKLDSIKMELLQMKDLNKINFQQRTNLLQELEELDKNLSFVKKNLNNSSVSTPPSDKISVRSRTEKDLLEIEQTMKRLRNEIQTFTGISKDPTFCDIDEGINKLVMRLDDMELSKDYHDKRIELLRGLNYYSELLEKRAEDSERIFQFERKLQNLERNNSISSEDITEIIKKLKDLEVVDDLYERRNICIEKFNEILKKRNEKTAQFNLVSWEKEIANLEKKIDDFRGLPCDSTFIEIKEKLQELSEEVQKNTFFSEVEMDQQKNKLLDQIQTYIMSLNTKAKENSISKNFISQLESIKNQGNTTMNREVMTEMLNRLKHIQANAERTSLSEKIKNNIQRRCASLLQLYSEKISLLPKTNYIGSEEFLRDLEQNKAATNSSIPKSFLKQHERLTEKVVELEAKVEKFMDNEETNDYKQLEDEVLKIDIQVKKLNDLNNPDNAKNKMELKERVVNCLMKLDDKVQYFENLEEIDNELDIIGGKLESHSNDQERDKIDEKLISLQVKLGKLSQLNKYFPVKKSAVLQKIQYLMETNKHQTSNSNTEEDSGTSI